jgi:hypothetical protein
MKRLAVVSMTILAFVALSSLAMCKGGAFEDPGHEAYGGGGGSDRDYDNWGDDDDDNDGGGNPFVGTWRATTGTTLRLNADLTGSYLGSRITYTYSGTTATITVNSVPAPGSISSGRLFWGGDTWTKL